jgi:hypothetical protein
MIQTIVIPTKGRPATLKRTLTKYIGDAKAHLRNVELVVADGATTAADRNKTKEVLKALAHEERATIRYMSSREVEIYAKSLAQEGGDAADLLAGKAIGAMRNAALLDTVGQTLMFVDDDTQPKLAQRSSVPTAAVKDNKGATELASDPTMFTFYPSRGEALTDRKLTTQGDVLQMLSSELGMPVEGIWPTLRDQGVKVKGDRVKGTVLATNVGVYGDPAGLTWRGYPELLGGLTRSSVRAGAPVRVRGVFRAPVERVIQSGPFFPTHAFALDNTKVLPPFLPFETSRDGLSGSSAYGYLLGLAFSNAFISFQPWAIYHDPSGPREYADHVVPFGIRDLAIHVMGDIQGPNRLQKLAERLEALEEPSGSAWIHDAVEARRALIHDEIEARAIALEEDQLCNDVRSDGDDFPKAKARKALIEFGKLLRGWPDLVKAAKALKEKNIRVSTEL